MIKKVLLAAMLVMMPVACSRSSSETPQGQQQQTTAAQPPASQPAAEQPESLNKPAPAVEPPRSSAGTRTARSKPADRQPSEVYRPLPEESRQAENNQRETVVPPSPTRRADGTGTTADNSWEPARPVTPAPPPKPTTATLSEGSVIDMRLTDKLTSATNHVGDKFSGTLERDLVVDGNVLAPKGSRVTGKISDVAGAGKVKGLGRMAITLTGIQVGDEGYGLNTSTITVEAENTKSRDAKVIGGGAAIGAAIGAIAGGGRGAAIGAAVGGGAGTAGVLVTKGKEVEFQPEQKFSFRLEKDVDMRIQ